MAHVDKDWGNQPRARVDLLLLMSGRLSPDVIGTKWALRVEILKQESEIIHESRNDRKAGKNIKDEMPASVIRQENRKPKRARKKEKEEVVWLYLNRNDRNQK